MFVNRLDAGKRLAERSTLATPHDFYGVSVFYRDFSQVTDDDVVRLLEASPVSAPE